MKDELKKLRHARSAKDFPGIKLDEDEHVVLFMKRSLLGLMGVWLTTAICLIGLTVGVVVIFSNVQVGEFFSKLSNGVMGYLYVIIALLYIIIVIAGFVAHTVYSRNKMYITNKRAIQNISVSLFNSSTNVIELQRIEDVSFRKEGFLNTLFNVGTLRMSTVGDETTYTFPMLDTPHDEVEIISKLVRESHGHHEKTAQDASHNE